MKIWIRNTLFFTAVAITAAGIAAVCALKSGSKATLACNDVRIEFEDSLGFISASDVKSSIKSQYGDMAGRQIDAIDLTRIEQILESRSAVENCEAWTTNDGKLHVSIRQRHPSFYLSDGGVGTYVDFNGFRFPGQNGYRADVPEIRTGNWRPSEKWIEEMIGFIRFINGEERWIDRIDEISSQSNGELSFALVGTGEKILFGQPVRIKEKFSRIDKYCTNIRPLEKKYKTVNVIYSGHIICN